MKLTLEDYNINISFNFGLFITKLKVYENSENIDLKCIKTKHRRKVLNFFNTFKIPYSFTKEQILTAYKSERGFTFEQNINTMDLIHELCHYLISERKDLDNFGLGTGFYDLEAERFFEYYDCLDEEHCVLFLEFILARYLFNIPLNFMYHSMVSSNCDILFLEDNDSVLNDLNSYEHIVIKK